MKTRVPILLVIFGLLALGVVVAAHATPSVSWHPKEIDVYAIRGTTTTLSLTVTPSEDLADAVVRVTPEVSSMVVVSPATLRSLKAGQPVTLTLTVAPPASAALGPIAGAIQIRNGGSPGRAYGRALGVKVTIDPFALPPDPGEAGKATLQGIDTDQDGVRDDVERYIAYTYPVPSDAPTRAALTQFAIPLQAALLDASNESKALQYTGEIDRASECLSALRGVDFDIEAEKALQPVILNTPTRSRAYLDYDAQLGGHVFEVPAVDRLSACTASNGNGGAQ